MRRELTGVVNTKTLERHLVQKLIHYYQVNCAAIFKKTHGDATLSICAHYSDQCNDKIPIQYPATLKTFHPSGKQLISHFFNKYLHDNFNAEEVLIQKYSHWILTCIPINSQCALYLETSDERYDLQTWEKTANIILDQTLMLYEFVQMQNSYHHSPQIMPHDLSAAIISRKQVYDKYLSQVPFGFFRCGPEGECLYANEFMLSICGMSFEQAYNEGWTSALHQDDAVNVYNAWLNLKDKNIPFKQEYRLQTPTGKITWVYGQIAAELDPSGQCIGYAGTIIDISKRREAEEQIRMHHKQLANMERLHGMGEIVSGLAHELNQPLTVISVYAQECQTYFQQHRDADPKIAAAMEKIRTHANRSGEIIHRINDLFQKGTLQYTQTTLATIINKALETIAESELKEALLNYDLQDADVEIQVDELQIEQVMINLFKNAYEAMLHLPKDKSLITLGSYLENDEVHFYINDTGNGIPKVISNKIFEPFFSSKKENMGLGLAICSSIINAHNGDLILVETSSTGTQFKITLPIKAQPSCKNF